MKTIINTAILLIFISMNSQNYTLTDYNWTIEKIVTADATINAIEDENNNDILLIQNLENNDGLYYGFSACNGLIYLNQSAQGFDLLLWGCAITPEYTDIASFFYNTYLSEESNEVIDDEGFLYSPFTYVFREENGLVYLDITNPEGSVATFWASTLSNNDIDKTKFSIYPNPVSNQLHIDSDQAKIEQIIIYNLNGKQVFKVDFHEDQSIELSNLAKGMYLVKVKTETGSLTKKLIKK